MSTSNSNGFGSSSLQDQIEPETESSAPLSSSKVTAGLYVLATPIGNARDITLRALDLLESADTILCEDTRVSAKLLLIHGVSKKKLQPYHEHNAQAMRPKVLEKLRSGEVVVLISDAGTPLINDPGYKLVRDCAEEGLLYTHAPGPSSVIAALVLSGLPSDRFFYLGFLPNKSVARSKSLEEVKNIATTLICLESPKRLAACLADMAAVLGAREASVVREITKKFEEIRRAPLDELAAYYAENEARGEIVIVIGPPESTGEDLSQDDIDEMILNALERLSLKDAVAEVVGVTGLQKRTIYNRALELKS